MLAYGVGEAYLQDPVDGSHTIGSEAILRHDFPPRLVMPNGLY